MAIEGSALLSSPQGAWALFGLHLALLLVIGWSCVGRISGSLGIRIVATVLVVWSTLVYAGTLLGAVGALRSREAYLVTSVVLMEGCRRLTKSTFQGTLTCRSEQQSAPPMGALATALLQWTWISLAVAVCATLLLAFFCDPNNWDTVVYRYPRAIFYLGEGSLRQYPTGDARLVAYPFGAPLLYLFPSEYGLVGRGWMLLSVANWLLIGVIVGALANRFGASRKAAWFASWSAMLAPNLLVQAASGNDDSLAAMPLLAGVYFLSIWWESRERSAIVVGAMGVGLSLGTKPHAVFLWPAVIVLAVSALTRARATKEFARGLRYRWKELTLGACVAAPLVLPFACFAFAAKGTLRDPLSGAVLHGFTEPRASVQTLGYFSLALATKPLADLPVVPDARERRAYYQAWNEWLHRWPLRGLVPVQGFAGPGEPWRFEIFDTELFYYEHSVSPGLLPYAMLSLAALLLFSRQLNGDGGAKWFLGAFFAWHLGFSYLHRVIYSQLGTYYGFATALGAPAMARLWDLGSSARRTVRTTALFSVTALVLSHLVSDFNVLMYNSQRSVPRLLETRFHPGGREYGDAFRRLIRDGNSFYVPATYWSMQHFDYMKMNAAARFRTGVDRLAELLQTETLLLLHRWTQIGAEENATLPLFVPDLAECGYVYVGLIFDSAVQVFARGATARRLFPDRCGYLMANVQLNRNQESSRVEGFKISQVAPAALAEGVDVRLEFLSGDGTVQLRTDWSPLSVQGRLYRLEAKAEIQSVSVLVRLRSRPDLTSANVRTLAWGQVADWATYRIERSEVEIEPRRHR